MSEPTCAGLHCAAGGDCPKCDAPNDSVCIRVGGCLHDVGASRCFCDHPKGCNCYEHRWFRAHPDEYAAALAAAKERTQ